MMSIREITQLVEELVNERFKDAEILSVEIKEDFDADDEAVLRVRVVFNTADEKLDARTTSSFLRYLRPKLSEAGVNSFPIMSFISQRDAGVAA